MKTPLILLTLCAMICAGCATQKTVLDESVNEDGTYKKTTTVKTRTFFDSKNELTKLKTSSTEKTQSVGIDGINQSSSGSNAVALAETVVKAAVTAAVKSVVPVP